MAPPTKRAKLSIEVIIIAEEDDEQADGERGRIEIEDVNVQMMYQHDIEAALGNNNHMDPEEAGQLDDTQVSQTEAENEEDSDEDEDEDEEKHYHPCDWCKKPSQNLLMVFDEDICRQCVAKSDLELGTDGEWDYPKGQFEEIENASEDGLQPASDDDGDLTMEMASVSEENGDSRVSGSSGLTIEMAYVSEENAFHDLTVEVPSEPEENADGDDDDDSDITVIELSDNEPEE